MAKVIHDKKESEVIAVETEWEWGYYQGEERRKPLDTWLLLNTDGYLHWVNLDELNNNKIAD